MLMKRNPMKNSTRKLKVTRRHIDFVRWLFIADSHRVVFTAGRQRRGGRGASERDVTPPLLAKVQGNLEVSIVSNLVIVLERSSC